tara:strand:- start:2540 stop:3796 length:1257 start_codon:yes stop_codon:yes gene_type:complete
MLSSKERSRLKKISEILYTASSRLRILRTISWSGRVRYMFFRNKGEKLPEVKYKPYDPTAVTNDLSQARRLLQDSDYDGWFLKKAKEIELSANLLANCGTREFFNISAQIYGLPNSKLHDGSTTPLDLAYKFEAIIDSFQKDPVKNVQLERISADEMCVRISRTVKNTFGNLAPKVIVVDELSAKATATSRKIKIRKKGRFYGKDVQQLINHEALVHVATTINGRAQGNMRILGANYGSVTKTQEGLAVFSEFITGSIDIERMRRIVDRVLAIRMAIDGADFIEVYRFFMERTDLKNQAFENARRVFRGGVMTGGAPFTKDIVYLDGLIRVHNFFRSAVSRSREDVLRLVFAGKMELDDIPIIAKMAKDGLVKTPEFIPPWASDLNFLICYFAFSVFIDDIDYKKVGEYYDKLFDKNI